MKYFIFIFFLVLSSCVSNKEIPKGGENPNKHHHLSHTGNAAPDSLLLELEKEFSNTEFDDEDQGFGGSGEVVNAVQMPSERERIIYRDIVRNSTSERVVNNQSDLGQVIYKVPDTMWVRKSYEVLVRISKSQNNIEIKSNINGKVTTKNIQTSNHMTVELIDPDLDKFQIKEINSKRQLVDSLYTEWRFTVTPLKSGTNKLDLVISIVKNDDVKQVVYSDEIFVHANAPAQIKSFWFNNWKWSIETLIIPVVTWLFGLWWGKRSEKKKRRRY